MSLEKNSQIKVLFFVFCSVNLVRLTYLVHDSSHIQTSNGGEHKFSEFASCFRFRLYCFGFNVVIFIIAFFLCMFFCCSDFFSRYMYERSCHGALWS